METILEVSLSNLKGTTVGIPSDAKPLCYRFIDAKAFVTKNLLRIFSLDNLPSNFATISYPWQGLPRRSTHPLFLGTFTARDTEGGGDISIDILMTSCRAAIDVDCTMIWLDRLCIMQDNKVDKDWQIKNMHSIYKECSICLVLLGGLSRLAELDEETTWAKRAWTLQEALVPPTTKCLFSWKKKAPTSIWNTRGFGIVESEHSAITELEEMLNWSVMRKLTYGMPQEHGATDATNNPPDVTQTISIINSTEAHSLWGALKEDDSEGRDGAIWRCALMRTSSRSVDMVFSIMGLFGVTLDPSKFSSSDRNSATIALAQGILQNGGKASWLGLSMTLQPSSSMSTMPAFPKTSVSGGAVVDTRNGPQNVVDMIDSTWFLRNAPTGKVDSDGYLWMRGQAMRVQRRIRNSGRREGDFVDDKSQRWRLLTKGVSPKSREAYAVVVGVQIPSNPPFGGTFTIPDPTLLMIIERHGEGKFHRKSFVDVGEDFVKDWEDHDFAIGGSYRKDTLGFRLLQMFTIL